MCIVDVDQSLYYFMGTTRLRLIVMDTLDNVTALRLKDMRPVPNNIALIANTASMVSLVQTVSYSYSDIFCFVYAAKNINI